MKPERTGREINSRSQPSLNSPSTREYIPTENEIATAIAVAVGVKFPSAETSLMTCAVVRPMIDVGPILISEITVSSQVISSSSIIETIPFDVPMIR